MKAIKKAKLEKLGYRVTDAKAFLGLTEVEMALIRIRHSLAQSLLAERERQSASQLDIAKMIGSSQSRVAKMEAGDPSVSLDLLIRSLLAIGSPAKRIAQAIGKAS